MRSVHVIVGTTDHYGDCVVWLDDQVCLDGEIASKRLTEIRKMDPCEGDVHYFVRDLRVETRGCQSEVLLHAIQDLQVDELRERRKEVQERLGAGS